MKKDEELQALHDRLRDYEQTMKRLESVYEERMHAIDMEREQVASERDQLIITLRERNDEVERVRVATQSEISTLK